MVPSGNLADWLAAHPDGFTQPQFHCTRVGQCKSRASNGHEQYVPELELVSVTEHIFDQKYTTSWAMDDLHHQMIQVTQASLKSEYSQGTASRQSALGITAFRP